MLEKAAEGVPDMEEQTENITPGEQLMVAREAKGWSQDELADRLNLKKSDIVCIEENDYSYAGALVYIRGHLRSYANAVGLPPHEVLESFDQLGWKEPSKVDLSGRQGISASTKNERSFFNNRFELKKWLPWLVLVLVALLGALVAFWWHQQAASTPVSAKGSTAQPFQMTTPGKNSTLPEK